MSRTPQEWRELLTSAGESVHNISDMLDDWESQHPSEKEESAIFDVGGEECCDEVVALKELLDTDQFLVFGNKEGLVNIHINCSDVFAWACADSEPLMFDDLAAIYKIKNEKWGIVKWCCKKRNQKPQKPVERDMKIDGAWDAEMEALPENTMDAEVHQAFAYASVAAAKEKERKNEAKNSHENP
ncbi:MAG: hypothetical protein M0R80_02790 [Proteobacteria bacterium]|jgi:hypothetical protein|nr:hypothetical protein [Pseudomonadota bacterium]